MCQAQLNSLYCRETALSPAALQTVWKNHNRAGAKYKRRLKECFLKRKDFKKLSLLANLEIKRLWMVFSFTYYYKETITFHNTVKVVITRPYGIIFKKIRIFAPLLSLLYTDCIILHWVFFPIVFACFPFLPLSSLLFFLIVSSPSHSHLLPFLPLFCLSSVLLLSPLPGLFLSLQWSDTSGSNSCNHSKIL